MDVFSATNITSRLEKEKGKKRKRVKESNRQREMKENTKKKFVNTNTTTTHNVAFKHLHHLLHNNIFTKKIYQKKRIKKLTLVDHEFHE